MFKYHTYEELTPFNSVMFISSCKFKYHTYEELTLFWLLKFFYNFTSLSTIPMRNWHLHLTWQLLILFKRLSTIPMRNWHLFSCSNGYEFIPWFKYHTYEELTLYKQGNLRSNHLRLGTIPMRNWCFIFSLKWKVKFHFKKMKNKSRIYSFRKQIL